MIWGHSSHRFYRAAWGNFLLAFNSRVHIGITPYFCRQKFSKFIFPRDIFWLFIPTKQMKIESVPRPWLSDFIKLIKNFNFYGPRSIKLVDMIHRCLKIFGFYNSSFRILNFKIFFFKNFISKLCLFYIGSMDYFGWREFRIR